MGTQIEAINFDLDTNALKERNRQTHPAPNKKHFG